MNQIYIISDGENIKIGFSKHPERRLKQIQTGHPKKLKLIYAKATKKAREIEKRLHTMLVRFRCKIKGEWFKISPDTWLLDYIDLLVESGEKLAKLQRDE